MGNKHSRIFVEIQEIHCCAECPEVGSNPPGTETTCGHFYANERPTGFVNPWEGIPKWCPLDAYKDVTVTVKRKKNKPSYWKNYR